MKAYLAFEDHRNRTHAALYTRLIQKAFGEDTDVLVGHHICFEKHGQISTEEEIPSADTLLFDHDIMYAVFGEQWQDIMIDLCKMDSADRESWVEAKLDALERSEVMIA